MWFVDYFVADYAHVADKQKI